MPLQQPNMTHDEAVTLVREKLGNAIVVGKMTASRLIGSQNKKTTTIDKKIANGYLRGIKCKDGVTRVEVASLIRFLSESN